MTATPAASYICPGCMVLSPWEHRCCRDEENGRMCECPECVNSTPTDKPDEASAVDPDAIVEWLDDMAAVASNMRRPRSDNHYGRVAAEIEALRARVAGLSQQEAEKARRVTYLEVQERKLNARVVELAGALDKVAKHIEELYESDVITYASLKYAEEARTVLAAPPAEASERARAKDEALNVLRGYYTTKLGQHAMVKQVGIYLAKLDALGKEEE